MFIRNLFILAALVIATTSYSFAEPHIIREHVTEQYKVEKPVKEHSAERTVAGEKPKKEEKRDVAGDSPMKETSESGVHYWKYSE
jgi:hypothetical protein